MAYELRSLRRYKAVYDNTNEGNLLKVAIVRDGAPIACVNDSEDATATIYTPDGGTAIETDTDLTQTEGNSVYTLAIDTSADTTNYTKRTGYRADLSIEIDSVVYTGQVIFDVVGYLLQIPITYDQLLDRDPRLRGRDYAGDDKFVGLIESCRDHLQLKLEGIAHDYGTILEDMAIDDHKLSVAWVPYVLWKYWITQPDEFAHASADDFREEFEELWRLWIAQFKPDTTQSGVEGSSPIKQVFQRLRT